MRNILFVALLVTGFSTGCAEAGMKDWTVRQYDKALKILGWDERTKFCNWLIALDNSKAQEECSLQVKKDKTGKESKNYAYIEYIKDQCMNKDLGSKQVMKFKESKCGKILESKEVELPNWRPSK